MGKQTDPLTVSAVRKNNKKHLIFLCLFIVAGLALKLWQQYWPDVRIVLKDKEMNVLLANTPHHLYQGLSDRDSFGRHEGMLFLLGGSNSAGFVMRDMRFPIDMVWFDGNEVVDIAPNVPLESGVQNKNLKVYYPRKPANMVLELPAGWTEQNGLKIGDKVYILQ